MNQELVEAIKELTSELEKMKHEIRALRNANVELKDKIDDLNHFIENLK